jgi:ribosomal-protein-alanine N-acetyltransferase
VLPKLKKAFNPEVCHRDFYISNISVHPDYKRQGVGAFILKNAHKVAEKNYASRILLDVSSENNPALSLYKKHGFTQRGWGLIKAGGKSTKVLWMSKSL